ncbi:TonB-dependent receptor [Halioglobus maricola]|uniref:TonB-dependent receptor n=1 Tax=Halioglobus maricola TaxID=2601894 RepID=A0A5P9NHY7_9GAMM|nr:TonB-dependent receptor [Halioglobus maricola]QFU75430.1 TonB-dependent receptor [Halioglobus maricola]
MRIARLHFARLTPIATALLTLHFGTTAAAQDEASEGSKRYSLQLEEVLVTAQKREENFMSVPVTVNAFTAQDMVNTGADDIRDIDTFMPGVEIGSSFGSGSSTQAGVTVRGVSSPNISSGGDPSVATFYDGTYMPRAATSIPFTDIARTEVLKGPQGTLFGRNATAGVINIVPNRPNNEFEAFVKTRVGNHNLLRLEGMVNTPVSDNMYLRANVFSHQRDGLTEQKGVGDDVKDEGYIAARGALLWDVTEDTSLQLAVDIEDRDEAPSVIIGVGKYAYESSDDPFSGETAHDVIGGEETREMYGVSLKLESQLTDEWSTFGIVSYRDWDTTNLQEEDGTAQPRRYLDTNNLEDSDIFYTELRFHYVTDKLNFITGGNYSKEDVFQRTDIGLLADSYMQFVSLLLLPEIGIEPDQDTHAWDLFSDQPDDFWLGISELAGLAVLPPSFAGEQFFETMDNTGDFVNWGVFADATYQLTDTLSIAAGLRYSYDEKEYSWQTYESDIDWPYAPERVAYIPSESGAPADEWFDPFSLKDDWSKTTGRLVLDWAFSDYAMFYASAATGYKSGGFDGQSFSAYAAGPFDPEDMTSFEMGLKGDFFDESLRVEAAVFYHELDGKQNSKSTKDSPDDPTASPTVVTSDEEAEGIEIIVTWSITENLRVAGLTTYRETTSIEDKHFNAAGEPAGGEAFTARTNNDYTLRLDWTPNIPTGYLLVHMNYVFNEDPSQYDPDEAIFVDGPWYFNDRKMLNARVAWTNENDNIEVALWGDNLLDEEYASNPGGLAADTLGATHTSIRDTITYGIDLRYAF